MPQTQSKNTLSALRTVGFSLVFTFALLFAMAPNGSAFGDDDPKCPAGSVWSSSLGKCVKSSGALDDEIKVDHGVKLALAGEYERAIEVLKTSANQTDPYVLTYIGYSFRKLGQLDKGIRYYAKAIAINPNYIRAREYLGEGYVASGQIAKAEDQLWEIEKRCGAGCAEYQKLAQVIAAANG